MGNVECVLTHDLSVNDSSSEVAEPYQAHVQQNAQDEISEYCFVEPVSSAMDSQCNDCDCDGGSSVASLSDGEADLSS